MRKCIYEENYLKVIEIEIWDRSIVIVKKNSYFTHKRLVTNMTNYGSCSLHVLTYKKENNIIETLTAI